MIGISVSGFQENSINSINELKVNRLDIVRGLIGIARDNPGLGIFGFLERVFLGLAYVENKKGTIWMNTAFGCLEKTEKSVVSYQYGQALTYLFAQKILNIPHIYHLEDDEKRKKKNKPGIGILISMQSHGKGPVLNKLGIPFIEIGLSPDLIGIGYNGEFHVLESKFHKNFNTDKNNQAINQVSNVALVNGSKPITKTVCYFSYSKGQIEGIITDPDSQGGINIEINKQRVLFNYYKRFIYLNEIGKKIIYGGIEFKVIDLNIESLGNTKFGVESNILNIFSKCNYNLDNIKIEEEIEIGFKIQYYLNYNNNHRSLLYKEASIHLNNYENIETSLGIDGLLLTSTILI